MLFSALRKASHMLQSQHGLEILGAPDDQIVLTALRERGAVLIRNPSPSLEYFADLSDSIMTSVTHHATGTNERDAVAGDSRTSTVNKGSDYIPLHREGSYAPACPDVLMFYCENPAVVGGATTVCDGVAISS
jgi:hypothetical protein